jgi:REP element-mobilizing transposase RayT
MKFNPESNRRRSIRLHGHDYSAPGKYFLTICAHGRELIFGSVKDKHMNLSSIGDIAERYWKKIPEHFPNIRLDGYCIMPNHIHGILIIEATNENKISSGVGVQYEIPADHIEPLRHIEPLHRIEPLQSIGPLPPIEPLRHINPLQSHRRSHSFQHTIPKSIGSIIRAYKTAVTKRCKENGFIQFVWQRNFHDRIIRNDSELRRIQGYTRNNPANWEMDEENPKLNRF